MSSEMKAALSALKQFKDVTSKHVKEKTVKAVGFVWYDLLNPRLISLLIFFYIIFFSGNVLGRGVSYFVSILLRPDCVCIKVGLQQKED